METIFIPHLLKSPDRQRVITVDNFIPSLETLTPVRGTLIIRHGGNFLDLSVKVETIITLSCDRCLQQYNHRLKLNTSELIWLDKNKDYDKSYPLEREIAYEDLSESLDPNGDFEPQMWLYEQLCLTLPPRQLCSANCQPPAFILPENASIDGRWASLESLKSQSSQSQN
jgi:uncharacterized protein